MSESNESNGRPAHLHVSLSAIQAAQEPLEHLIDVPHVLQLVSQCCLSCLFAVKQGVAGIVRGLGSWYLLIGGSWIVGSPFGRRVPELLGVFVGQLETLHLLGRTARSHVGMLKYNRAERQIGKGINTFGGEPTNQPPKGGERGWVNTFHLFVSLSSHHYIAIPSHLDCIVVIWGCQSYLLPCLVCWALSRFFPIDFRPCDAACSLTPGRSLIETVLPEHPTSYASCTIGIVTSRTSIHSAIMATTPPPPSPSALRMPAAPRHGPAYDGYEPYPTRASARLANQRVTRIEKTPPPSSPSVRSRASGSPKKQRKVEVEGLSPPRSTPGSPRKKARLEGHAGTHPTHSLPDSNHHHHSLSHTSVLSHPSLLHPPTSRSTMAGDMLPTPIKTPSKKAVDDHSAARALFAPPMSTLKRSKKHTGFSLGSFSEDLAPGQPAIQIYTDSRDRIPTMDPTEENPFYANPAMPKTSEKQPTRTSKRRAAKRDPEVEGSLNRDDGIYCVL